MSGMGFGGAGGLAVVLLHGLALAGLLSAFGSLFFFAFLMPPALTRSGPAEQEAAIRLCSAVSRGSLILAILLELAWLTAESGVIAGASNLSAMLASLPVVVRDTLFGHLVAAQILALIAAALAFGRGLRARIGFWLAGLATVLEAWHLHGAAMQAGLSPFLLTEIFHVLAAGGWLGGILPLAFFIRMTSPETGAVIARRFSDFATPCVLLLAITAFLQGRLLIGSIAALTGTTYGWIALLKLGLFAALLCFAARHRWRLAPALSGAQPFIAREVLARSIVKEAVLGLVILLAAAMISSLAPPADMAMFLNHAPPAPVSTPQG
jgi:putative copper resistance protein D